MNLRETVENYARAVSNQDYYDDRDDSQRADAAAKQLRYWERVVDLKLAVAEASIALCEYQAFAALDQNVEVAVYFRERDRLWEAFMQAHKAAKEVNQS